MVFNLPRYTEQLKQDVRYLRIHNARLSRASDQQKQKSDKLEHKNKKLHKENNRLKKRIKELEQEVEKFTKTNNRYRVAIFDHGNFQSPTEKEKKKKGGQTGHRDTNRESIEDTVNYQHKRIFLTHCSDCRSSLTRVASTQRKILLDIVLNPKAVKLVIESERQWCGHCKKPVRAKDSQSLPFSEYGINTFMMALLLRYHCHLPLSKIANVFKVGYGLDISKGGLVNIFHRASIYLEGRYEELKKTVRQGSVMYNDETGWQVRGKNVWMWIMASKKATVYIAAESRGKGIAKEIYGNSQAYSMHDGYASYTNTIPKDKHLYCWAHILRFCFEETINKPTNHESVSIRDSLVDIYHLKKNKYYQKNPYQLEQEATQRIKYLLKEKAGRDPTSLSILNRLEKQHEGLIRALTITPNGTNNFAEQELRPIALARKISYGSDTFTGMETTAILSSIVQTIYRTKPNYFFPSLTASLRKGFVNS